jgi:hypothetical protein
MNLMLQREETYSILFSWVSQRELIRVKFLLLNLINVIWA